MIEQDYPGSKTCQGSPEQYVMQLDFCYQLYGNRAFVWKKVGDWEVAGAINARKINLYFMILVGLGVALVIWY